MSRIVGNIVSAKASEILSYKNVMIIVSYQWHKVSNPPDSINSHRFYFATPVFCKLHLSF